MMNTFTFFRNKFRNRRVGIGGFQQFDFIGTIHEKRRFYTFTCYFFFLICRYTQQFFKQSVGDFQIFYRNTNMFYFPHILTICFYKDKYYPHLFSIFAVWKQTDKKKWVHCCKKN